MSQNATALTQKMAEKYFGNWHDAVGKIIKLDNTITLKVGGILENPLLIPTSPLGVVSSYEALKRKR